MGLPGLYTNPKDIGRPCLSRTVVLSSRNLIKEGKMVSECTLIKAVCLTQLILEGYQSQKMCIIDNFYFTFTITFKTLAGGHCFPNA